METGKIKYFNDNNIPQNITIEKRKRNISMDLNLSNIKISQYQNINFSHKNNNERKNSFSNLSKGKNLTKKIDPLLINSPIKKFKINQFSINTSLQIEKINTPKKPPQSAKRIHDIIYDKNIDGSNQSKFNEKSIKKLNSFNLNNETSKFFINNKIKSNDYKNNNNNNDDRIKEKEKVNEFTKSKIILILIYQYKLGEKLTNSPMNKKIPIYKSISKNNNCSLWEEEK
jgi:hypothetical protein